MPSMENIPEYVFISQAQFPHLTRRYFIIHLVELITQKYGDFDGRSILLLRAQSRQLALELSAGMQRKSHRKMQAECRSAADVL